MRQTLLKRWRSAAEAHRYLVWLKAVPRIRNSFLRLSRQNRKAQNYKYSVMVFHEYEFKLSSKLRTSYLKILSLRIIVLPMASWKYGGKISALSAEDISCTNAYLHSTAHVLWGPGAYFIPAQSGSDTASRTVYAAKGTWGALSRALALRAVTVTACVAEALPHPIPPRPVALARCWPTGVSSPRSPAASRARGCQVFRTIVLRKTDCVLGKPLSPYSGKKSMAVFIFQYHRVWIWCRTRVRCLDTYGFIINVINHFTSVAPLWRRWRDSLHRRASPLHPYSLHFHLASTSTIAQTKNLEKQL